MNVLVTGATGFIGHHLIERLIAESVHVRILAWPKEDTSMFDRLGVEVFRGDVLDYGSVQQAASNCQRIFHLAARTEASGPSRKDLEEVNVQGTVNVARAALVAGASRLVFCTSGAVFGRAIKNRSISEATTPIPDSPYGQSKFIAEQALLSNHRRDGLSVVLARTSAVLGPGAMSWLNLFRTIAAGQFRLIGEGDNHHHVADIADIVDGLVRCGSAAGIEGRTYILAGAESIRLRDLVQTIGEAVGAPALPTNLPAGPFRLYEAASRHLYSWLGCRLPRADRIDLYLGDRAFDLSQSRRELGYRPTVSTKEAVFRTAAWFKEHGYI
ncbi:NAD-dependent epimerase/dehydratase family protein [Nitrospira lenta]|uniref:Putative NAD-dependent epimerase/dehydratase n=1 Tax=Nitrospira lenta TaxID=1436998 RepID=A0A330L9N7_9BACT|nr:NAD-dependent epimerase/dehydratase family protein [Nitrospira lenta]SPP63636.1 putative NAD-dependent epimerase/dehydratase [Nitrospira lenta]